MIFAAGLNTFGQLAREAKPIRRFQAVCEDSNANVLLSTWSSLTLQDATRVVTTGYQNWESGLQQGVQLHSAVGDHNGLLAALDQHGDLHAVDYDSTPVTLRCMKHDSSPSLSFLAMTGTGHVAIGFQQAPNGNLAHIGEFGSFDAFIAWHTDPINPETYPIAHHMIPGRPKQLLAGVGSFAMLMEDYDIYTWGDPRHRSLARSVVGEAATAADKPGLMDALAGLQVKKIALGGWLGGAVTEDGAAYIWGATMPGKNNDLACLRRVKSGELVALLELSNIEEEPEVVELAIGDGHAILATADGKVFVVGENAHGQLGLHGDMPFVSQWTEIEGLSKVEGVTCGSKSTFILAASRSQTSD